MCACELYTCSSCGKALLYKVQGAGVYCFGETWRFVDTELTKRGEIARTTRVHAGKKAKSSSSFDSEAIGSIRQSIVIRCYHCRDTDELTLKMLTNIKILRLIHQPQENGTQSGMTLLSFPVMFYAVLLYSQTHH